MGIILSKLKPKTTAKVKPYPYPIAIRGEERRRVETVREPPLNTEENIIRETLEDRRLRLRNGLIELARQRRMGFHEVFAPLPPAPPPPPPFMPSTPRQSSEGQPIGSLAKGGKIKKTGLYKLHAGELVVKKERVEAVKKAVKTAKLKPLKE